MGIMRCENLVSPLGELRLCSDGNFLTALTFAGQKYENKHIPPSVTFGSCPVLEQTKLWLQQYFAGIIPDFLPPIKISGTPFQECIWELLQEIPYGKTVTYGDLAKAAAKRLGKETMSAQAVGSAVGRNPISILIPCHRVIGSGGQLTGYAAGTDKKEALLKLENGHLP